MAPTSLSQCKNCDRELRGQIVDLVNGRIFGGRVLIRDGRVGRIHEERVAEQRLIMPGFIDAHVHIESSMLVPSEFARLAVVHGTVATVSDPHEIANVLGVPGIEFMIANSKTVPFKFFFGVPSCVPATGHESAGAVLGAREVAALLARPALHYLAEMMNFPGVIHGDAEVHAKLEAARRIGKPIDGHAPGLRGEELRRYIAAGPSTDHESFTTEEGAEKLGLGMKILLREGSAAKNFDALIGLMARHGKSMMFCSDDKHPDDLVRGHINELVKRAYRHVPDRMTVLRAASLNPVRHYGLDVGLLREGDAADFIIVDSLDSLVVQQTVIDGFVTAENGVSLISSQQATPINAFAAPPIEAPQLLCKASHPPQDSALVRAIEVFDRQIITGERIVRLPVREGYIVSEPTRDILKLVVYNRYHACAPAIGFVVNTAFKRGAIASSVAHDSHNIVAVGTSDAAIVAAVNLLVDARGGISVWDDDPGRKSGRGSVLPLPMGGLMSVEDGYAVARQYEALDAEAKSLGTTLTAPFMTLSFLALLVIPQLKLSDRGLFDGRRFEFVPLEIPADQT